MRVSQIYLVIILTSMLSGIAGCKKPIENPELLDPIYADLLKESKFYDDAAKTKQAELEAIKKEWEEAPPQTGREKMARNRYYNKEREVTKAYQTARFFELRARTRKSEDKKAYLKAFLADKPWPDPNEYEAYQMETRLTKANRNWDARTKKWSARLKEVRSAASATGAASPAAEAPKGH